VIYRSIGHWNANISELELVTCFHAGFWLGSLLYLENGGENFLRNLTWVSTNNTALYLRRYLRRYLNIHLYICIFTYIFKKILKLSFTLKPVWDGFASVLLQFAWDRPVSLLSHNESWKMNFLTRYRARPHRGSAISRFTHWKNQIRKKDLKEWAL
jgi:hypothetical protein